MTKIFKKILSSVKIELLLLLAQAFLTYLVSMPNLSKDNVKQ